MLFLFPVPACRRHHSLLPYFASLLHPAGSGMNFAPPTILNDRESPFGFRDFSRNIFAFRMIHFPGSSAR